MPIGSADPHATETVVELRVLSDGTTVVPVYRDRDRLVAGCGPWQPWMLMPMEKLADLREVLGFEQIMLDVELPPEERKGSDDARG